LKKPLREIYKQLREENSYSNYIFNGISDTEIKKAEAAGFSYYEGKVRQCFGYDKNMFVVHTDRLSAFDRLIGHVPFKGSILNVISDFWLRKASEILPTHYLTKLDERTLKTRKASPIKTEVIVRGYLAGSMMREYKKGQREFCGNSLPENLSPYSKLPEVMITPTTKAAAFEHDENSSADQLISEGIVTSEEWKQIDTMSRELFRLGSEVSRERDWILVDTKYEFGRLPDGQIILIDEIHTPDSSRLWKNSSYESNLANNASPEMLDKEIIRNYLLNLGFEGKGQVPDVPREKIIDLASVYLDVAESLIGEDFYVNANSFKTNFYEKV